MGTSQQKFYSQGGQLVDTTDPVADAYRATVDFEGRRCCDNKACQLWWVKHPMEVGEKELRLNIGQPGTWHGDMDYSTDAVRINFSRKSVLYHYRVVQTEFNGVTINGTFCEHCYSVLELIGAV